jgi:hypothetical protein
VAPTRLVAARGARGPATGAHVTKGR